MPDGVGAVEPHEGAVQFDASRMGELPEPRLPVSLAAPVELATVAGGQEQRGATCFALSSQQLAQLGRGEGELLAHADSGCMVAHANDMESGGV